MSHNDDIEHTVRLDYNKIKDPYETIDVPDDTVDFDKLNAELESISADFSEQPQDDTHMETIRFEQIPDYDTNTQGSSEISSDIDFDFDALIATEADPDFKLNSSLNMDTDTDTDTRTDIESLVASDMDALAASDTSFESNGDIDDDIADNDFDSDTDIESLVASDVDALAASDTSLGNNADLDDDIDANDFDSDTDINSFLASDIDALAASDTSLGSNADLDFDESETTEQAAEELPLAYESTQLPLTSEAEHVDLTSDMMVEKEAAQADSPQVIKDEPESLPPQVEKSPVAAIIATCALIAGLIGVGFGISAQKQISEVAEQLNLIKVSAQPIDYTNELIDMHEQIDQLTGQLHALESKQQALSNQVAEAITPSEAILPIAHDNPAKVIEPQMPIISSTPKVTAVTDNWNVIISSHDELSKAKIQQQRLLPTQTEIQPAQVNQKTWYRTVATGFASKPEAVTFINKLKKEGIPDAWLQHQAKGK